MARSLMYAGISRVDAGIVVRNIDVGRTQVLQDCHERRMDVVCLAFEDWLLGAVVDTSCRERTRNKDDAGSRRTPPATTLS